MRLPVTPILLVAQLLTGCASTDCPNPIGTSAITPEAVSAAGGHTGELVRWGGEIAMARNLSDQTELEVIGYPLDRCGRPQTGADSVGRFVVIYPGYLETVEYGPGRQITLSGLVTGTREGSVGEAPYLFPLVQSRDIRLLEEADEIAGYSRPWMTIGIGGGSGGIGGGIGVSF